MSANLEDIYELTPMQQGMLFHSLYTPETDVYHVQLVYELEGMLDVEALVYAWRETMARHGVLRTGFTWEDLQNPYQVVHRSLEWMIEQEDWRDLTPTQQQSRWAALADDDKKQPFDLQKPPLLRVSLIRLSERNYRLIWTFHHIILEGWSAAILHGEVGALYSARLRGIAADLPAARPYRDFIRWLSEQDAKAAESYWTMTLAGVSGATRVPLDRFRGMGPAKVVHCAEIQERLSMEASTSLKNWARNQHLTLNTVFQGIWSILLSRYSGEKDVVFGTVVSGRPADLNGSENMVGLFVNSLPARVSVQPDRCVSDWLQEVQRRQAAARQFESSSLAHIQSCINLPQGRPLIESLLVFENWLGEFDTTTWLEGVRAKLSCSSGSDNPLTFIVAAGAEITLSLRYDAERFDRDSIVRMHGHLKTLTEGILSNPGGLIADLPMLTDSERNRLLVEWNRTAADYPKHSTIGELFGDQAERNPHAVAMEEDGRTMTYSALHAESNRLARHLRKLGVGPEVAVGLVAERSLQTVVAILGILKSGGAYVPLDPDYPGERLAWMLADTQAPLLLAQESFLDRVPAFPGKLIALESVLDEIKDDDISDVVSGAKAETLAYVMYTSGSTGRPKGVRVEHRCVVRLVKAANYVELGPPHVLCLQSTLSFDASTFEIWGSLLNGSRLVIPPTSVRTPRQWGDIWQRMNVTTVFITTALFNQIIDEAPEAIRGLRQLLVGGEAASLSHFHRALEEVNGSKLIHVYGPTENTTFSTYHVLKPGSRFEGTVPIGRPISNTTVYIVDEAMNPVPVGVPGELYTGGDGLARDYLNQPELTREKFVPNPFSAPSSARLYRTGDHARYLSDGAIEFVGRMDGQIKLRGFRIELGEIEARLGEHPQVLQAIVVAREDRPGDKRLAAYVRGDPSPDAAELREFLRHRLPDYMIPSAFVSLESFPLTSNGKVDRAALPAPAGRRDLKVEFAAPRTAIEVQISEAWQEILGVDQVGLDDSFFDLGGNSLLLVQVHGKLTRIFGREVPITDLFRYPTIRALSQLAVQVNRELKGLRRIQERAGRQRDAMIRPVAPGGDSGG